MTRRLSWDGGGGGRVRSTSGYISPVADPETSDGGGEETRNISRCVQGTIFL